MPQAVRAQDQGTVTRITSVPEGALYLVDGQPFNHSTSAIWPTGSKHTLSIPSASQNLGVRTLYNFIDWEYAGGKLPGSTVTVTASPAIGEYKVVFGIQYAIGVSYFNCPDPANCPSPGTINVNGTIINSSQDVFVSAGGTALLQAFPNAGYVFTGWLPGPGQVITGFLNSVTVNSPIVVYPTFQVARKINFLTDPPELTILADRTPLGTPSTLDWAFDSVHTLGANSPQQDKYGKMWAFKSWSDGGDLNHAYKVGRSNMPDTVTASYVPAAGVSILTLPVGLKIKVDGQFNALNGTYFAWGVGETHHLEAPLTQVDAQGRTWQFSAWSNGGAATQDVVVPTGGDVNGYRLTATYKALTKLSVTSSLTGLSLKVDGVACDTPCDVLRSPGTPVKISAPATVAMGDGARADFDGWPGGGTDFTVTLADTDTTVYASYHRMNRLSSLSDPPNGAVWTVLPASSDGFYNAAATVALSLTAQPGYRFRRWDGDLSGTIPSGVVAMTAPRMVKAVLDTIPYIAPTGISNAAGATPLKGVAPGSIISIFGANLSGGVFVAPDGMLPQTLGSLTARVGERVLPLMFVSPQQINANLPDDIATGQQILTVSPNNQPDVRVVFNVVRNAPGLFPVPVNDQAFAMAVHEDGSAVTTDSPAKSGELLTVYGTGFGPADHARLEGFPTPASPDYLIVDDVSVQAGDVTIAATKSFAAPGKFGVDAVQFRLSGVGSGSVTFKVTVGGVDSNTVLLPVE
ncbi:MAG: hypothetical protein JWP63_400 [Candidatus Solibacter sp.]|nr:hypothetical protein [Candidatus Solibacter sp.]